MPPALCLVNGPLFPLGFSVAVRLGPAESRLT